jgi:hypothetical protein
MYDQDVPGQGGDMECFMSSMASAGWCIEHLFQQNNDNFSRSDTISSDVLEIARVS